MINSSHLRARLYYERHSKQYENQSLPCRARQSRQANTGRQKMETHSGGGLSKNLQQVSATAQPFPPQQSLLQPSLRLRACLCFHKKPLHVLPQFLPSAASSWKEAAPNACVRVNGATHPTGSACLLKTQTFSPRALPHPSRGAQGASDASAETWRCQGGAARAGHSHEGEVRFPTAALSEPSQVSVCPR